MKDAILFGFGLVVYMLATLGCVYMVFASETGKIKDDPIVAVVIFGGAFLISVIVSLWYYRNGHFKY